MIDRSTRPGTTVSFWTLDLPDVAHAVSTRAAGNLSFAVEGADPADVRADRRRLAEGLEIEPAWLVCPEQVHGTVVQRVGSDDRERGAWSRADVVRGADALITDEPGVVLMLMFADCVPVLLVDPVRRAVGAAHAGWKGTAGRIASRTVEAMVREFGSRPEDLRAAIGPAIGGCCYEVSDEVAAAVLDSVGSIAPYPTGGRGQAPALREAPDSLGDHQEGRELVRQGPRGQAQVDLAEANRRQLVAAGLVPGNVEVAGMCTSCQVGRFFSHRAEHGKAGRHAALIGLRP
jgi:hypothetical protein